jgi:mRNA interferase MazF
MVSQGDIIWLDLDPQVGREQKGRRPALVISNNSFNRYSSMHMICPITSTDKQHAFHLSLDDRTKTSGVILCDQARVLDIKARNYDFIERLPSNILEKAKSLLISFID